MSDPCNLVETKVRTSSNTAVSERVELQLLLEFVRLEGERERDKLY